MGLIDSTIASLSDVLGIHASATLESDALLLHIEVIADAANEVEGVLALCEAALGLVERMRELPDVLRDLAEDATPLASGDVVRVELRIERPELEQLLEAMLEP